MNLPQTPKSARSFALLLVLGPFSDCLDEARTLVLGTNPIEERPVVLASASAAPSASAAEPERADPRTVFKLPSGEEASYEYAEAKRLMVGGRLVAAALIITPKALGETGTKDELDLLAELCEKREDKDCMAKVAARRKGASAGVDDLRKLAKSSPEDARTLLLPRLQSGEISAEEAEILAGVCAKLRDKECEGMAKAQAKK